MFCEVAYCIAELRIGCVESMQLLRDQRQKCACSLHCLLACVCVWMGSKTISKTNEHNTRTEKQWQFRGCGFYRIGVHQYRVRVQRRTPHRQPLSSHRDTSEAVCPYRWEVLVHLRQSRSSGKTGCNWDWNCCSGTAQCSNSLQCECCAKWPWAQSGCTYTEWLTSYLWTSYDPDCSLDYIS